MVSPTETVKRRYKGVLNAELGEREIVQSMAETVVNRGIVALRIAGQPPYGYVFRVDDRELIEKVWIAKSRVTELGEADYSKKPVTSLTRAQVERFADWQELANRGFSRKEVLPVLDLSAHIVLPVVNGLPDHLIMDDHGVSTVSTFSFPITTRMGKLVNAVSKMDTDVIVGGTSLNRTGTPAIVDSAIVLRELGTFDVDLLVLSDLADSLNKDGGQFHPMVAFSSGKSLRVIRKGIGFKKLADSVTNMGVSVVE